jgi:hypothetical protein
MNKVSLARAISCGIAGSLAGTIIMDLVQIALLPAMGEPAGSFFGTIGEAAGTLITKIGIDIVGGIPLGLLLHYLLSLLLGVAFGLLVSRIYALRVNTTRRGVVTGILAAEAVGLILFVPVPVLLSNTSSELAAMFGAIVLFHALYGAVLGGITSHGLRRAVYKSA